MGFEENSPPLARQPLQVQLLWDIQTQEGYCPQISENSLLSLARETPSDSGVQDLNLVQDNLNFPRLWLHSFVINAMSFTEKISRGCELNLQCHPAIYIIQLCV